MKTNTDSRLGVEGRASPHWEAMAIALERVRIDCTAGRCKQAENELLYLLNHLHQLHIELKRTTVVECERKEVR